MVWTLSNQLFDWAENEIRFICRMFKTGQHQQQQKAIFRSIFVLQPFLFFCFCLKYSAIEHIDLVIFYDNVRLYFTFLFAAALFTFFLLQKVTLQRAFSFFYSFFCSFIMVLWLRFFIQIWRQKIMCYSEWVYCLSFSSIIIESRKVLTTCQSWRMWDMKMNDQISMYLWLRWMWMWTVIGNKENSTTIVLNASSFWKLQIKMQIEIPNSQWRRWEYFSLNEWYRLQAFHQKQWKALNEIQ